MDADAVQKMVDSILEPPTEEIREQMKYVPKAESMFAPKAAPVAAPAPTPMSEKLKKGYTVDKEPEPPREELPPLNPLRQFIPAIMGDDTSVRDTTVRRTRKKRTT